MKRFRWLCTGVFCLATVFAAQGQDDEYDYKEEITYGVTTNTNSGLIGGVMFKYAHAISPNQYRLMGVELVNVKHPKETRYNRTQNSFIPGKAIYFFALRPHYGREFVLFRKAPEDGVQLNLVTAAGPSIGISKPYYVIYGANLEDARSVPYSTSQDPTKTWGAGRFLEGFDQLKFNVGAHVKAGLSFEFGKLNNSVMGMEVGGLLEAYSKEVLIIPNAGGNHFFSSAFFTLYYGNKY
ncbi:hypothetical protein SAMN05421823_103237 [Catalinimonas alkaloidigena]|uniref:Outer membrane protein beta-barrel domain-containing protein n=1 Tax=Catalinimonas alkaloidigena TaxID=1075417 RepID=A0A1G9DSY7_9BACT|nr:hypothetical protein [Catalinimonas alkaloidigena]SDK66935.1 hypothetical protein SAMN05421823_103237 [Catalinimonas alkaloidigena]